MVRALSVNDLLTMKKDVLPLTGAWAEAFGEPERTGVWFIWGNSGNGKTSFAMQLCRELTRFGRVAYDSLEEADSLSIRRAVMRAGMEETRGRFVLLPGEGMDELSVRLKKRRSPDFVVIDSFQYTGMTYRDYIALKERHRDKLLVFISHAEGTRPAGSAARSVMYDASLKVWVEGYRAFSKGRFFGPRREYTVWKERADAYWGAGGEQEEDNNNQNQ